MESFYGGRPGNSFVIAKNYESLDDLTKGFNNNEVQVGEYALIADISDANNGDLYLRTATGQEYIGNLAGTSGKPAEVKIVNIDDNVFKDEKGSYVVEAENLTIETGKDDDSQAIISTKDDDGNVTGWFFRYRQKAAVKDDGSPIQYLGFNFPKPILTIAEATVETFQNAAGGDILRESNDSSQSPYEFNWVLNVPALSEKVATNLAARENFATEVAKTLEDNLKSYNNLFIGQYIPYTTWHTSDDSTMVSYLNSNSSEIVERLKVTSQGYPSVSNNTLQYTTSENAEYASLGLVALQSAAGSDSANLYMCYSQRTGKSTDGSYIYTYYFYPIGAQAAMDNIDTKIEAAKTAAEAAAASAKEAAEKGVSTINGESGAVSLSLGEDSDASTITFSFSDGVLNITTSNSGDITIPNNYIIDTTSTTVTT